MGGAQNHRMGLWDAAMIKDNHVAVAGSVGEAVRRAVAAGIERIIVEVDRLDQIEPGARRRRHPSAARQYGRGGAARGGRRWSPAGSRPRRAAASPSTRSAPPPRPASTYVSVGRITQSAPAADIGLDFAAL